MEASIPPAHSENAGGRVMAAVLAVAIAAAAAGAHLAWKGDTLRDFLRRYQFWILELQFVLVAITTGTELPQIIRRLPRRRAALAAAFGLAALTWTLTAWAAPRTSRIYYDEQIYQGVGRNLSDLHLAQMCNDGTVEYGRLQCWRSEYNKEPYGYPYLLSLAYRAAGVADSTAFRLNNVVSALTALVVFLLAQLLFKDLRIAVVSALALALVPMQLTWSNTASAEPSAVLFTAAAVLAAVHFVQSRTTSALVWTMAVSAFATTIRPESVLVIPLVGLVILLWAPEEMAGPRLWWSALLGLALTWVTFAHLVAVRSEGWGASEARFGWQFAISNAPANFWFYFGDQRFPVLLSLAALAGLASPGNRRQKLLLGVYFLAFWTLFVVFYAGSYNYGADVRFSIIPNVPLVLLAGSGLVWIGGTLLSRWPGDRVLIGAVAAVLLFQFLWYLPLVRETGEEAWAARADVAFAKRIVAQLPPNSIILTHNPGMFHVWGINAAQLSLASTERGYVNQQLMPRYAGGVYLHWSFWCNVADEAQKAFCRAALDAFQHDLVGSYGERDYRYAFYRLREQP